MLTSHSQYERASAVVSDLEKQIRRLREKGDPVPPDLLARARDGAEEVVCFELAEEGRALRGRIDYVTQELRRRRKHDAA